jgi:hypothetical protein
VAGILTVQRLGLCLSRYAAVVLLKVLSIRGRSDSWCKSNESSAEGRFGSMPFVGGVIPAVPVRLN